MGNNSDNNENENETGNDGDIGAGSDTKGKKSNKSPKKDPSVARGAVTHELKTEAKFFIPKWAGAKTFSIRKNDRDFQVNDFIWFYEIKGVREKRTGRRMWVKIIYILEGSKYVDKNNVVISFKILNKFSPMR